MAIGSTCVWEVRTTGSDTNGGGYTSGGTDWSQQDAAQYSVTDGVTAGTTTITSATASFGTDVVGNVMYVQGGTGAVTAGWYQIISRTDATTIVVDRSTGLTAGTGVTLKIGGALASPGVAASVIVAGNTMYIKSGTYTISSTTANVANGRVSISLGQGSSTPTTIKGYGTTREDFGTAPLLQAASPFASQTILTSLGNHARVENLNIDGASLTSTTGISVNGINSSIHRIQVRNTTATGISAVLATYCYATGCSGTAAINAKTAYRCVAISNSITGFSSTDDGQRYQCISASNTGGSSHGFNQSAGGSVCVNCLAYGNGGNGLNAGALRGGIFVNCISYGNTGWGLAGSNSGWTINKCAFGSNTSGAIQAASTIQIDNITLTADPFVAAGSANFALNATAGGGALLRDLGLDFPLSGFTTTTGYMAVGPVETATSSGSGGIPIARGMHGGMR